jgi:hypothetical protein
MSRDHNSFESNMTRVPLQYAHLHSVIFRYTKSHQNPSKGLGGVAKTKLKGQTDRQTARRTTAVWHNTPTFLNAGV